MGRVSCSFGVGTRLALAEGASSLMNVADAVKVSESELHSWNSGEAQVRPEPVVGSEPDVIRCRTIRSATTPPFEGPIPSASTTFGSQPNASKHSAGIASVV